jgi:uncharacterized membrane protein
MALSPEERRRIYEEEKARLEAEEKKSEGTGSSTNLNPRAAALLCYLGGWITGIIFLLLEQKNRFVRFHAIQSIIVFAFLNVVYLLLTRIPFIGWFLGTIIGVLAFVLWIVLMVRAHQGEVFELPVAGQLATKLAGPVESTRPAPDTAVVPATPPVENRPPSGRTLTPREAPDRGHAGRIASSAFAIAWSIALLVLFHFYHDYIAYYHLESRVRESVWVREPVLTVDFNSWLPIVTTVLIFSIAGHALLLAIDKYILRETTLLVLDLFGIMAVFTLISIFPFDFSAFASADVAAWIELGVRVTLGIIVFAMGIAVIVRLIKILVNVIRGTATY